MAVTTLDSLEKVAAPWRNAANTDQEEEEEEEAEVKSQPAAPEPEELPGKHISGVAVICKIIVWSAKIFLKGKFFSIFFYVRYSTLLRLPPLRPDSTVSEDVGI